jgi:hypothetical protein
LRRVLELILAPCRDRPPPAPPGTFPRCRWRWGCRGHVVAIEWLVGHETTVAASYYRRLYDDGVPDLDFGSARNSFLLLASADVKGFHCDANSLFNEQTDGAHRLQTGQTLSISHPIVGRLSLSGGIWHFTQPYLRGHAVGNLWALSYATRKNSVFDIGFNRGLTDTSTRWEAFVGFTYLLPHRLCRSLWMNR